MNSVVKMMNITSEIVSSVFKNDKCLCLQTYKTPDCGFGIYIYITI